MKNGHYSNDKSENILSIDIGGTNINGSILNRSISIDELNQADIGRIEVQKQLNETLPDILTQKKWDQILKTSMNEIDMVSICGPFEVVSARKEIASDDWYVKNNNIPFNLTELVSEEFGKPTAIRNDAVAWARGIFKYHEIKNKKIKFPALVLCFGTGVGMARAAWAGSVQQINIKKQYWGDDFPKLTKVANYYGTSKDETGGKVHAILGRNFFKWVDRKKGWNDDKKQEEYTKRLVALLHDLCYNTSFPYGEVETVFLSGGSVKYISKTMLEKVDDEYIKNLLSLMRNIWI